MVLATCSATRCPLERAARAQAKEIAKERRRRCFAYVGRHLYDGYLFSHRIGLYKICSIVLQEGDLAPLVLASYARRKKRRRSTKSICESAFFDKEEGEIEGDGNDDAAGNREDREPLSTTNVIAAAGEVAGVQEGEQEEGKEAEEENDQVHRHRYGLRPTRSYSSIPHREEESDNEGLASTVDLLRWEMAWMKWHIEANEEALRAKDDQLAVLREEVVRLRQQVARPSDGVEQEQEELSQGERLAVFSISNITSHLSAPDDADEQGLNSILDSASSLIFPSPLASSSPSITIASPSAEATIPDIVDEQVLDEILESTLWQQVFSFSVSLAISTTITSIDTSSLGNMTNDETEATVTLVTESVGSSSSASSLVSTTNVEVHRESTTTPLAGGKETREGLLVGAGSSSSASSSDTSITSINATGPFTSGHDRLGDGLHQQLEQASEVLVVKEASPSASSSSTTRSNNALADTVSSDCDEELVAQEVPLSAQSTQPTTNLATSPDAITRPAGRQVEAASTEAHVVDLSTSLAIDNRDIVHSASRDGWLDDQVATVFISSHRSPSHSNMEASGLSCDPSVNNSFPWSIGDGRNVIASYRCDPLGPLGGVDGIGQRHTALFPSFLQSQSSSCAASGAATLALAHESCLRLGGSFASRQGDLALAPQVFDVDRHGSEPTLRLASPAKDDTAVRPSATLPPLVPTGAGDLDASGGGILDGSVSALDDAGATEVGDEASILDSEADLRLASRSTSEMAARPSLVISSSPAPTGAGHLDVVERGLLDRSGLGSAPDTAEGDVPLSSSSPSFPLKVKQTFHGGESVLAGSQDLPQQGGLPRDLPAVLLVIDQGSSKLVNHHLNGDKGGSVLAMSEDLSQRREPALFEEGGRLFRGTNALGLLPTVMGSDATTSSLLLWGPSRKNQARAGGPTANALSEDRKIPSPWLGDNLPFGRGDVSGGLFGDSNHLLDEPAPTANRLSEDRKLSGSWVGDHLPWRGSGAIGGVIADSRCDLIGPRGGVVGAIGDTVESQIATPINKDSLPRSRGSDEIDGLIDDDRCEPIGPKGGVVGAIWQGRQSALPCLASVTSSSPLLEPTGAGKTHADVGLSPAVGLGLSSIASAVGGVTIGQGRRPAPASATSSPLPVAPTGAGDLDGSGAGGIEPGREDGIEEGEEEVEGREADAGDEEGEEGKGELEAGEQDGGEEVEEGREEVEEGGEEVEGEEEDGEELQGGQVEVGGKKYRMKGWYREKGWWKEEKNDRGKR